MTAEPPAAWPDGPTLAARAGVSRETAVEAGVSRETERDAGSVEPTSSGSAPAAYPTVWRPSNQPFPRPLAQRIITVANQKGGVGKTTTAVNLGAAMAQHRLRVLCIDLDPQGNLSTGLGVEHRSGTPSVYDVLIGDRPLAEIVVPATDVTNLWCAPATIDLAGAEIELVPMVARESRLARALRAYPETFDYIFIDCPPSLGLLTVNALVAAAEVLIPIQCEYYALEGLSQLLHTVDLVQSHLNPLLRVSTVLLTMFDSRTKLAEQVADEVRAHFRELVLPTVVPRSVRISEAPGYGQSIMTYDPGSRGALTYLEAAREIAERGAGLGSAATQVAGQTAHPDRDTDPGEGPVAGPGAGPVAAENSTVDREGSW